MYCIFCFGMTNTYATKLTQQQRGDLIKKVRVSLAEGKTDQHLAATLNHKILLPYLEAEKILRSVIYAQPTAITIEVINNLIILIPEAAQELVALAIETGIANDETRENFRKVRSQNPTATAENSDDIPSITIPLPPPTVVVTDNTPENISKETTAAIADKSLETDSTIDNTDYWLPTGDPYVDSFMAELILSKFGIPGRRSV